MVRHAIAIFGICILAMAGTGCTSYRDARVHDLMDVITLRSGQMKGVKLQVGPAELDCYWEEHLRPTTGRTEARKRRLLTCWELVGPFETCPHDLDQVREANTERCIKSGFDFSMRSSRTLHNDAAARDSIAEGARRDIRRYLESNFLNEDIAVFKFQEAKGQLRNSFGISFKKHPFFDLTVNIGVERGAGITIHGAEVIDFVLGLLGIDIMNDDIPTTYLGPHVNDNRRRRF